MQILLIRHGATASNLKRLYLGRSDEPLCEAGVEQARARFAAGLPAAEKVFVSPLFRCRQTAAILFPDREPIVIETFAEIDFGRFEGRSHDKLMRDEPAYARWLDSRGEGAIPGGEDMASLRRRCRDGFLDMVAQSLGCARIAAVAHGGTIMAVLGEFCEPPRAFYDGFVKNCGVVRCAWDGARLRLEGGDLS